MEIQFQVEYSAKEHELRDGLEQNVRQLEERNHQLQNKVGGLEAALKLATEKAEADQRTLQSRHEHQLGSEKQMNLKLRGEAGILKKSINRCSAAVFIRPKFDQSAAICSSSVQFTKGIGNPETNVDRPKD